MFEKADPIIYKKSSYKFSKWYYRYQKAKPNYDEFQKSIILSDSHIKNFSHIFHSRTKFVTAIYYLTNGPDHFHKHKYSLPKYNYSIFVYYTRSNHRVLSIWNHTRYSCRQKTIYIYHTNMQIPKSVQLTKQIDKSNITLAVLNSQWRLFTAQNGHDCRPFDLNNSVLYLCEGSSESLKGHPDVSALRIEWKFLRPCTNRSGRN